MELTPLQIYIILHIKRAGVEYAKMIMKMTQVDLERIEEAINYLISQGILERDSGSAIKRSRARFKRASEVHKHHTYYKLSRKGAIFSRKINEDFLENYFNNNLGRSGYTFLKILANSRDFEDACKKFGKCEEFQNTLIRWGFITESGKKTRYFSRFADFAGL